MKLRWTGDTAYSNDVAHSAKNGSGLLQTGTVVDVPNALGEHLLASNGNWEPVAEKKAPAKKAPAKKAQPPAASGDSGGTEPDSNEGEAEL